MDSLTIKLILEGKEKKFTTPSFLSGKLFRQAAEISKEIESGNEDIDLDKNIVFVCDVFGNQFDSNQFEEGIDSRKLIRTIYATVNFVVGNIARASQLLKPDDENDDDEAGK